MVMSGAATVMRPVASTSTGAQTNTLSRIIIALDLDAFYVAASRKRDPSLVGLPVGIKQKHILATVSYEGRARGVKKLALIRDAMRQCPELILVNGEDLSYFRKVSNEIFHLVSSMVWGGQVEKLGMDELFCDVTEMVEHLHNEVQRTQQWPHDAPFGIVQPAQTAEVLRGTGGDMCSLEPLTQRLLLATHIARQIRDRVAEEVGLTSSAGIATSKYLAKLVGNTNKPNKQTVFAPLYNRSAHDDVQRFLDPYPVRSLNGFGSAITAKMCETAVRTIGLPESAASAERMTVLVAREIFDRQALVRLFDQRLADRLYGLLHGIDDEPVVRAPDYPAQISIEDTYRVFVGDQHHGLPFDQVPNQFFVLAQSLLRRLETELTAQEAPQRSSKTKVAASEDFEMVELPYDINGDQVKDLSEAAMRVRDYHDAAAEKAGHPSDVSQTWQRYPLSMRLSVRQGYTNRVSRQTRMPVEIFDLRLPRAERAKVVAQSCEALFRTILASEGDHGQGLNLINIAALDLSPHRPAPSIGGFFRTAAMAHATPLTVDARQNKQPIAEIDLQFLLELPEDVQREVASEYGISVQDLIERDVNLGKDTASVHEILPLSPSSQQPRQQLISSQSSSCTDVSLNLSIVCSHCGHTMPTWLQHDHRRWPITGLPSGQRDEHGLRWNDEIIDDGLDNDEHRSSFDES